MRKLLLIMFTCATLTTACLTVKSDPPSLESTIDIGSRASKTPSIGLIATESPSLSQQIPLPTVISSPTGTFLPPPTELPTVELSSLPEPTPILSPTMTATPTVTPTATVEPTATYWPTVTRQLLSNSESAGLAFCQNRSVSTQLLTIVTQQFSLPESYTPPDLVSLSDYFDNEITLDQTLYVRQVIIDPLQRLIEEMHAAGLRPSIISAYRSYNEQALAWHWWSGQYPGRVAIMSSRPGYSEHQLGTTIDFGSPAIDHLFHVDFANTSEGIWLTNNAYRFGFTLSFPANAYAITGIKYEPWHFRYVGTNLATQLFNSGQMLTSWQIENFPPPCIP